MVIFALRSGKEAGAVMHRVYGSPNVRHALDRRECSGVVGHRRRVHTPRKDVWHMTRRRTIVTAALLAGALGLTACGTNRQEGSGASGGSSCDTSKGTLVVGMVAPLSGSLSALGLGMSHSADL